MRFYKCLPIIGCTYIYQLWSIIPSSQTNTSGNVSKRYERALVDQMLNNPAYTPGRYHHWVVGAANAQHLPHGCTKSGAVVVASLPATLPLYLTNYYCNSPL